MYLVGEHDFKSFCTEKPEVTNTVRTIYSLNVIKEGDMIIIRVTGNGFLYNMVRIIAGHVNPRGRRIHRAAADQKNP